MKLAFSPIPSLKDPRWGFAAILLTYNILGMTVLGFNRAPHQVAFVVLSACFLDMLFHFILRKREILFPLSSFISGLGLGILANYGHSLWLPLIPVVLTVASKYLITFNGKHIFNPNMFGVGASLLWGQGLISASPSYQWGGSIAMGLFIVTMAYSVFLSKIKRNPLILSFIGFFTLALILRSYVARFHVPPETLFLGAITSPAFYLFTFFMITDPQTSPSEPKYQVLMSGLLVFFDLVFHLRQTLSTLFLSGLLYFTLKLIFLHARALWQTPGQTWSRLRTGLTRTSLLALMIFPSFYAIKKFRGFDPIQPTFVFQEIPTDHSGLRGQAGDVLQQLDPQIANIGKWLLSVGDAAAVADIDRDGKLDIFLSNSLKATSDRATLYHNEGNLTFKEVSVPALEKLRRSPKEVGVPSGGVFFDFDNDGDEDLYINVAFGHPIFLRNDTKPKGPIQLVDVTESMGLNDYTISVAANAADINKDGRVDLVVMNALNPELKDYSKPTPFNIFDLPKPEYPGDRRMLNVMHRTWHNAHNGGPKWFYINEGNHFSKKSAQDFGLEDNRWSLDFAFADLNNDGFDDLYVSNDFGPDEMYLNKKGQQFQMIRGNLVGKVGRDTYKGMNTTIADFDNNGFADIYVSNVHEKLQAEGSLLFLNNGKVDLQKAEAFSDEAVQKGVLNERRFGWGAAAADLDRDGRLDILQANGHIDDVYDKKSEKCEDFWYWNEKIALTPPEIHGYANSWAEIQGRCIFPQELNRVYLNQGTHFVDVAEQAGWTTKGNSRGMVTADFDNDGTLDVLVTHMTAPTNLYKNNLLNKNEWIGLKLVGNGQDCNSNALGTRLKLSSMLKGKESIQYRFLNARNGLSSQNDSRIYFGLPEGTETARVDIHWCGSDQLKSYELKTNQYHQINQNEKLEITSFGN